MKFKKAFAVILAVAMVITLMPTMAFAATSNTVSGVQTIAKSTEFDTTLELEVKNDPNNWEAVGNVITQEVTLSLDNAKWAFNGDTSSKLSADAVAGGAIEAKVTGTAADPAAGVDVEYCSPTSIILTIDKTRQPDFAKGDVIQLTLNLKSTNTTGDVKVDLGSLSGDITGGSYTVATVVAKATAANVPDAGTDDLELVTIRNSGQTASDIVIRESSAGVVSGLQTITLTLPKEVEWNADMIENPVDYFSGSLLDAQSDLEVEYTRDSDGNNNVRVIEVKFDAAAQNTGARRTLTISPKVNTTKNAKEGELTVTLRNIAGDISDASNLVIATIGQAEVSVFVDEEDYSEGEIPALYSGLTPDLTDEDNIAIITVKEKKAGNLTAGKYIDFTFDSKVQLAEDVTYSINGGNKDTTAGLDSSATLNITKDRSTFGWKVEGLDAADANEIKFYIPITVEAGYEGDVECVVSGAAAGIDEDATVVVATAKPVIKVETEVSKVRTGVQNQAINDIKIVETEAGALSDEGNKTVAVALPFTLAKDATVAVTDGDLEIKNIQADENTAFIAFDIDGSSVNSASTITISDLEITLNRNPAEGGYDIETGGDAVIDNGLFNDDKFADSYVSEDAIEIITPADSSIIDNKVNATFVVGESQYTNNGVTVAMDAASFIQNNRTYVPVRYLANALGVTDENIAWSEGARTVTLTGPNTVVTLTVGSTLITTSTGTITSDVPVIIKDNRTYLPARFVANAFGADVAWDAATRTVTITK